MPGEERLEGQTVLITGANGFLGRHIIARLQSLHTDIHAISRTVPLDVGRVHWWQGNAADFDWLRKVTVEIRPKVIYHLASASTAAQGIEHVLPTFQCDLQTTVNTLIVAREVGCSRVILTRSVEEPPDDAPPVPASPYAAAKMGTGIYGRLFYSLYELPVVILRVFMAYGPGQKDYKIIPYTITAMLKGERPALSTGRRPVDWIYVEDVMTAFVSAATNVEAVGTEIDIGSGRLHTIREVVEEIRALIPGAPDADYGVLPDRTNEATYCADTARTETLLKWRPKTSMREGLLKTIEWYRAKLCHRGVTGRAHCG